MNMDNAQILDKAQGALIGSALGDTIGIFTGKCCKIKGNTDNLTLSMLRVYDT
jgi:hypothetical protein